METNTIYQETQEGFSGGWDKLTVEDVLATAYTPRALEEFDIFSQYLDKDDKILEAGCGLGNQLIFLRRKGYNVVGIDYAPNAIRKVKEFDSSLPAIVGDIHNLPFDNDSFGAYLSFGVLEHFIEGPVPALKEANRILKKGGHVVVSMPGSYFLAKIIIGRIKTIFQVIKNSALVRKIFKKPPPIKPIFALSHSPRQISDFMTKAGFEVVNMKPTGHEFVWYTFIPFFRKNKLGIVTASGTKFASIVKRIFPWKSSFLILTVARKVKNL